MVSSTVHRGLRTAWFLPAIALAASAANAATFLVPDDASLVRASRAIVVATAGDAYTRWAPGGWIETVTALHVDEAIKGPVATGETIDVTELGGQIGTLTDVVPGSPRYAPGERVLLFLETNDRGDWVSKDMAVGKFTFSGGLLLRDSAELYGWDASTGAPHREPARDAQRFLRFVRAVAAGKTADAGDFLSSAVAAQALAPRASANGQITGYLEQSGGRGFRRGSFPVVYLSHGSQPGAPNGGLDALRTGLATWGNGNVSLQDGGTTAIASGAADGVNTVQFDDPANEIPGSFSAVGGATLAVTTTRINGTTHTFGGETFFSIVEADLVVQNGINGPGLTGNGFRHTIAHELGHSIGFRHSDRAPDDVSPCGPPLSCSNTALMNSSVNFDADPTGAALQAWDQEALAAVYGGGSGGSPPPPPPPPPCNRPSITAQPQSVALGTAAVVLSVTAVGDAPLHDQWYIGPSGNVSQPIADATGSAIQVQPAVTTMYWVRVSNACGSPADSAAATVTVNGCPAVRIDSISANTTVVQGSTTILSATASGGSGLAFQWYQGAPGETNLLAGTGGSITVTPDSSTEYWLRVTNDCGAFAESEGVIVSVVPCDAASVLADPVGGDVLRGTSASLFVAAAGTDPQTYEWFVGTPPDASNPLPNANAASIQTPAVLAPVSFWVRVTNACGTAESAAATLDAVDTCSAPAMVEQPHAAAVSSGSPAILRVRAAGTSLLYRWYQGPVLDFTKPVGGSSPVLVTAPVTAAAEYWVRISGACGNAVNSVAVTVTPAARRRPTHH